jgi:purine-cytosine permease-like protein
MSAHDSDVADVLPGLEITYQDDPRVVKESVTEDYSSHVVPLTARASRWSVTMAFWGLVSAMIYLVLGGIMSLAVGTQNALIGVGLSVVVFSALHIVAVRTAVTTGLGVALFSRGVFGSAGAVIVPLVFGLNAVWYTVFEGSVVSVALEAYFNAGPMWAWHLVVVSASIPLAFGGIRAWLDKFNGFLLPFYIIGLLGAVVWAIAENGYNNDWLAYTPENPIPGGWFYAFTVYMGSWVVMMYAWEYARFGKKQDQRFLMTVGFGPVMVFLLLFLNALLGMFLMHTVHEGALSETSGVIALVQLMGVFGLLFVIVSQFRVNTVNLYVASLNLENFVAQAFKFRLSRVIWVVIIGAFVYLIMLTNVFSWVLKALTWQGCFFVSWIGIVLVHILMYRRRFGQLTEFRPGRVVVVAPALVVVMVATAIGVLLLESGGSFGSRWALPIALGTAVAGYATAISFLPRRFFILDRPHDPRDEVAEPWDARIRCSVCERSYVAIEMDRDPSRGHNSVCLACAATSKGLPAAARREAKAQNSGSPDDSVDSLRV